jgi:hypothetical protein
MEKLWTEWKCEYEVMGEELMRSFPIDVHFASHYKAVTLYLP